MRVFDLVLVLDFCFFCCAFLSLNIFVERGKRFASKAINQRGLCERMCELIVAALELLPLVLFGYASLVVVAAAAAAAAAAAGVIFAVALAR